MIKTFYWGFGFLLNINAIWLEERYFRVFGEYHRCRPFWRVTTCDNQWYAVGPLAWRFPLLCIFNRWPVTWMNISSNQDFAVLDYITGTSNYRSLCQEEEIVWLPSTFVPSNDAPTLGKWPFLLVDLLSDGTSCLCFKALLILFFAFFGLYINIWEHPPHHTESQGQ